MSTKNLEKFNKAEMSNASKEDDASHSSMYKNQAKVEKNPEETVKFNKVSCFNIFFACYYCLRNVFICSCLFTVLVVL